MSKRHKVFISYYHNDDQKYKNELLSLNKRYNFFDDYSVDENNIDDTNKSSEQIRHIIRDEYIKDATVLILLCGENTRKRKHIDWEIHAAMYDTDKNPKLGILIINLPTITQAQRVGSGEDKALLSNNFESLPSVGTREELKQKFQYMPDRIITNFNKNDVKISVVNWAIISQSPAIASDLIHNAFSRRTTNKYDHSCEMRKNNT